MEIFNFDLHSLFNFTNLFAIILGTFVGLLFGAIPGLGAMITLALLLPVTYFLPPIAAILLMLAAYQGAEYGGSISSIILGIPGTPAAVATVLDGYTFGQKESPAKALGYSLMASVVGGVFGGLVLIFLSVPIASFALKLSSPEYFLIGVLGILAVATLSSKDMNKSMISVVLGLMAATVGIDSVSGLSRFTLNHVELLDGLGIVALVVGIFGFPEIFKMVNEKIEVTQQKGLKNFSGRLSREEMFSVAKPTGIGGIVGVLVGIFPGLGAGTATWFAYAAAKKTSKKPETFGKGNPEGIVGPEAANNASVGGSLLPFLTLGIPASPAIAIIMGAFLIHGIQPGPSVFKNESSLVHAILIGFLFTSLALYLMGRLLTPMFSRVVTVPNEILGPVVLLITIIGVYVADVTIYNVWVALLIGVIAYFLIKLDYSMPSFILAFVLGPIIELNLRRSLLMSAGDYSIFITRIYSLVILIIILGFLLYPIISKFILKSKHAAI